MHLSMFGNTLEEANRLDGPPCCLTKTKAGHVLAMTELRWGKSDFGSTSSLDRQDAYLISVELRELTTHILDIDGQRTFRGRVAAGSACAFDLRKACIARYAEPFHTLQFLVPFQALREIRRDAGMPMDDELELRTGDYFHDPVMKAIADCLKISDHLISANQLLVDQALLMFRAHLVTRYGATKAVRRLKFNGLAPWQLRRAKDILLAHISERISLKDVARECCLSQSAFVRGFSMSMGIPPHRWLTMRRIERAKELMLESGMTLANIALASGFGDQSHFTRVFGQVVGLSPSAWKRQTGREISRAPRPETRSTPHAKQPQTIDEAAT